MRIVVAVIMRIFLKNLLMNFWLFEDEAEMPNELLNEEGQLFEECKQCGKSLHDPPSELLH